MLKLTSLAPVIAVAASLIIPFAAMADEDNEYDDDFNPMYSSLLISSVDTGFSNIDRAISLGGTIGIRVPGVTVSGTNILAAEIDINTTVIPGENSGGGGSITGNCNDGGGDNGGGGLGGLLGGGDGGNNGGGECSTTSDNDDFHMQSLGIFAKVRSPGRFLAQLGWVIAMSYPRSLN